MGALLGEVSGEGRKMGFNTDGVYNTAHPARCPDPVRQGQACLWTLGRLRDEGDNGQDPHSRVWLSNKEL